MKKNFYTGGYSKMNPFKNIFSNTIWKGSILLLGIVLLISFNGKEGLSFFQKINQNLTHEVAKSLINMGLSKREVKRILPTYLLTYDTESNDEYGLKLSSNFLTSSIPPTALLNTYNAVVSCGVADLPTAPQYTFGLIDISSAIPASGRAETTSSAPHFVHSSWHLDSLGNVFGMAINNITGDIFAATSCNYQAQFFDFNSIYKYGSIGGGGSGVGADNVTAAGTVYKLDAITGEASVFVQLPQQSILLRHSACEDEDLIVDRPNHGVGLGNITFDSFREQLFIVNWEDGRIYRVDNSGNILDAYDPGNTDDGTAGVSANDLLPFGIAINNDGTKLFYGTMERELYSIDLSPTGSFLGTNSASGLGYDYYEDATETLHTTLPDNSGGGSILNFTVISDLEFLPNGGLLAGIRSTCRGVGPPPISTHPNFSIVAAWNHNGTSHLVLNNGSGQYNNVSSHFNVSYDSNHVNGEPDDYGGVSYRENLDGSIDYIVSSSDLINALGPHGIALFSESNASSTGLITPMGAVGYTNTTVDNLDPKGIGGDVQVFNALPVPCSDPTLQADNCDLDGDNINNMDDLDDDNDGIPDVYETSCSASGYANSASETGGVTDKDNAIGAIMPAATVANNINSAFLAGSDVLTLTLAIEQPAGTVLTLSMADRNGSGEITVTDEGTGSLSVVTANWNAEDELQYFYLTLTVATDVLTFTRDGGQVWVDGVSFCGATNYLDIDNDGVDNRFDLDSDNDGIYDADEAGHTQAHTNGQLTGGVNPTNGIPNNVDNGSSGVNYTLADSETTPDGTPDFLETDADGDTCNDTDEAGVSDTDMDGIAGTSTPTVDTNGLITSITYAVPANSEWQDPLLMTICLVNIAPTITSSGIVNFSDGGTGTVIDVQSTDDSDSEGSGLTYSFTGSGSSPDEAFFIISSVGDITFISPPDINSPNDVGSDNVYNVEVQVCDSEPLCTTQTIAITVAAIIDTDMDTVPDDDDLDDDNDGIPDVYEMACSTQDYAVSATETGGVTDKDNAVGAIASTGTTADNMNSAALAGSDVLILTLSSELPTGTVLTLSMADRNGDGEITVTDEGTGSLAVLNAHWGTEDILQYFSFTITAPSDVLVFTRNSGQIWVDGISYCTNYTDQDTDTDNIVNRLDKDSDGDGCADAYEANHGQVVQADSTIVSMSSDVGANGLADIVESTPDTDGALNYSIQDNGSGTPIFLDDTAFNGLCDFDGDGINNMTDIDDDNDGIIDLVEAHCVPPANVDSIFNLNGSCQAETLDGATNLVLKTATFDVNIDDTLSFTYVNCWTYQDHPGFATLTLYANGTEILQFSTGAGTFQGQVLSGDYTTTSSPVTLELIFHAPGSGLTDDLGATPTSINIPEPITLYNGQVCSDFDSDNDGLVNRLDLDSDNDGCSDAFEAGATTITTTNYQFPTNNVGNNGLDNSLEGNPEDGVVTYNLSYENATDNLINNCPSPCSDLALQADNCDFDGDEILNMFDLDDDNDGIIDIDETACQIEMNAVSATETGGVSNKDNAIGVLEILGTTADNSNSASLGGGDVLTLSLGVEVPTGEFIILSMADRNGSGEITVTDEGTGNLSILSADWNTEDVLQYFQFTMTAPTDILTFTRDAGSVWVDGINFCGVSNYLDIDNDGVDNRFDLDSDNDGIYDADEAGHIQAHTNGQLTGGVNPANGIPNNVDNGSSGVNYTLTDSETTPNGTPDFLETDADGDTCFDTLEEGIDDSDEDGIAGTGIPTVDANGLVTSITYNSPTIHEWQNPVAGNGCSGGIIVTPKIYLQGAYVLGEGKMQDSLRTLDYLSLTEPYTNMTNFTHVLGGGEVITLADLTDLGDNSIVDWVFIELRSKSDNTLVLGSQSALLQRDGDIVNTVGSTDLLFPLPPDDYYIVVQHRNHLGVMTANAVALSNSTTLVDFTTSTTLTWGTHAQKDLGSGVMALWAGDVNDDGIIRYVGAETDYTNISSKVLLDGDNQGIYSTSLPVLEYHNGDVDLNGTIRYVGSGTDQTLISQNVLLHPNNIGVYSVSMPIIEQLPE